MKKYQIYIGIFLGIWGLASCGKNSSFPSTPDFEYQSIYPKELTNKDSVAITCSFRDQEGDIQGSIWYKVYNLTTPDNSTADFDNYGFDVPGFPAQKNMEGTIITILKPSVDFSVGTPQGGGSDSIYFELFLKDAAGHISDTIRTDTVLIHAM